MSAIFLITTLYFKLCDDKSFFFSFLQFMVTLYPVYFILYLAIIIDYFLSIVISNSIIYIECLSINVYDVLLIIIVFN